MEEREYPATIEEVYDVVKDDPSFVLDDEFKEFKMHDRDYYNLMQIAIKKRPHLILEVDVKDKDFYEELIYLAIEKDIDVFTDIADKYKTYDICITALNKNISCIDSVPPVMIDEKMTLMVLNSKREDLYEFIKNKKIVAKAQ